ncbi:penicillin acylase family protein [Microbacterium hydrocarbonoxydans]|uniref:penicillin acylase family protein n=1 Tax=Microbacterium hydrocarbonoxydans TaxID=273678 RepID=UPI0013DB35AA|nr:penicillin acylase family protein [Microbacterium hydrocarbonoxydans]
MAEVFRDALGVPHIRATDVRDLARAQGEVTARDRGWQIEVDRLRAAGRLSELIGEAGVAWDVFARRARLDDTARRAFAALDAESRRFVGDYAAGVRRGMEAVGADAAEFRTLDEAFGDAVPLTPWDDHDPLSVLHVAHALFSTFPALLWREHVAMTLGDEWVDVFAGDDVDETLPRSGSNAWALHGSRTASGMPLLAGDPHRLFELPGVYQQVRLACDEFDVVGLAFPGVPGAPHFAHAGSAAWGITNAIAHSVEVFEEHLRATGSGYEALGPEGWAPVDVQRSAVRIRGGSGIIVEALETARGCVVTDVRPHPVHEGELQAWSIRHPARTDADLGAAALLPLLRARTAAEVIDAFGSWVDPVNRVFAADRDGAVLSATVGVAPSRDRGGRRRALPADAGTVEDRRPPAAVPVADVAVDANERPARAEIDLGWAYPSGHRARRIAELVDALRPDRAEDFGAIWADTDSGTRRALLPQLPTGDLPADAARVRDALVAWDGRMDADSPAAGLFAAWRNALVTALSAHPALAALRAPHPFGAVFDPWLHVEGQVAAALPRLLRHPSLQPDAQDLVVSALTIAATAGEWGATHRMLPLHVFTDVAGVADPGAVFDTPLSGDGDTVCCTGSTPGSTDRGWRGSVARWAWDLSDRERSLWSVPFGASGDPGSPHFADQHAAWAAVHPTRIVTDWRALAIDRSTGAA